MTESKGMPDFGKIVYERPSVEKFKECVQATRLKLMSARDPEVASAALFDFEKELISFDTMVALANILHDLDTSDQFYTDEVAFCDEASATVSELCSAVYSVLLSSPCADELKEKYGDMIFRKAQNYKETVSNEVVDDLVEESNLEMEYAQIQSEAEIDFDGKTLNLSMLMPYLESLDRETRKKAHKALDDYYMSKKGTFDEIYDKMVKIRTKIAQKLGYKSFIELGYKRMERFDYNCEDVAKFREAILKYIVPITKKIRTLQKERFGYDQLMFYDLPCIFKNGNPVPTVKMEDYRKVSGDLFAEVLGAKPSFFDVLSDHGFTDLISRKGKSTGGYCMYLEEYAIPFIFMNANGTADDVATIVHEGGHAYAAIKSAEVSPFVECLSPTLETCEIHSTSMEFLTYPYMEKFYGENAQAYRELHMTQALLFLPYGCMVDEFQHIVYGNPDLTPDERHAEWKKLEEKYQPFIVYDDHPFHAMGGAWMKKDHIFTTPFYYIDYCLAHICSLELWDESQIDYKSALIKYNQLCECGGTETFLKILEGVGLASPFDVDTVKRLAFRTCDFLEL